MPIRRVRQTQTGSALIALLIAALIVAILWVAQHNRKKPQPGAESSDPMAIESADDIRRDLDRAREARDAMDKQTREAQRKMNEFDRP